MNKDYELGLKINSFENLINNKNDTDLEGAVD